MPFAFVRLAGALTLACAVSTAAAASDSRRPVPGPIRAHLVRVLDGDTIEVLARVWPDHYIETRVRLDGIDIDVPTNLSVERDEILGAVGILIVR